MLWSFGWVRNKSLRTVSVKRDVLDAALVDVALNGDELDGVLRLEHEPAALRQKQPHRMPLARAPHTRKRLRLEHDHLRRRRPRRVPDDPASPVICRRKIP